jgi:hypothetical protein
MSHIHGREMRQYSKLCRFHVQNLEQEQNKKIVASREDFGDGDGWKSAGYSLPETSSNISQLLDRSCST